MRPSDESFTMRLFPVSATKIWPWESIAVLEGALSWVCAADCQPHGEKRVERSLECAAEEA